MINRLPKGLPRAKSQFGAPVDKLSRRILLRGGCLCGQSGLGSQARRLTRRPALSQSCQRAINAIYSFIFANLHSQIDKDRGCWQRRRDNRDSRDTSCPSDFKEPRKSCSCVCNAILFDLFEIYVYLSPSQLTFLGLRVQVSNCQTIAPDYPVGQPSKKPSFVRFPGFV